MQLKGRKVLVTGADGFIGSHLTERLVSMGADVRAFVFYNSFNSWGWLDTLKPELKSSIDIFAGDIRDPYGVRKAVEGCDVVLNLAALIAIPFSYHSPSAYVETNINGTLNVLQAARDLGVQKVVQTSTSEVYGTAQFVPMTEEHPLNAQSPYAATKVGADQLALSFHRSFGIPVSVIRPFNTYGPRQSARAVIPTIITQIANGKTELQLGAAHPTRDFNYVQDVVSGFVKMAEADTDVVAGKVINIGSNFEISIRDLALLIGELMGKKVTLQSDQERLRPEKSEVERLWAENKLAAKLLNWRPDYGGLEGLRRGLAEAITWYRDSDNLKHFKHERYNI